MAAERRLAGNLSGLGALLGWSLSVAFTRRLGEADIFGLPALSYLVSGAATLAFDLFRSGAGPARAARSPAGYWLLAGGAFVGYEVLFVASLAWSDTRAVVLPLGLVNYFWPGLTLLFMPWFFPCRLRPAALGAGLAVCLLGAGTAMLWSLSPAAVGAALRADWPAFALMAAAASLWGFYSNAVRKWGGTAQGTGWFMLTTGAALYALWRAKGGALGWEASLAAPFLVHALVVNALSYRLWDVGVRWGDLAFLGTLANALPLASMAAGAWYFGAGATPGLWIGGALVGAGAMLCRRGVAEKEPEPADGDTPAAKAPSEP